MSERKIYSPEHGVVILKDEDYVEVHRLEYERFLRSVRTVNDIGEQWTKSVLEAKMWRSIAEDLVESGQCAGGDECRCADDCLWVIATRSFRQAVRDGD